MKKTDWRELFPDGRAIFYEGDDPEGFVREVVAEFGFDPSADPDWGVIFPADRLGPAFTSYKFFCPPEYLDAIYGNDRWPSGS